MTLSKSALIEPEFASNNALAGRLAAMHRPSSTNAKTSFAPLTKAKMGSDVAAIHLTIAWKMENCPQASGESLAFG